MYRNEDCKGQGGEKGLGWETVPTRPKTLAFWVEMKEEDPGRERKESSKNSLRFLYDGKMKLHESRPASSIGKVTRINKKTFLTNLFACLQYAIPIYSCDDVSQCLV